MNNIDIKEKFFNVFEIEPKVETFHIGLKINGENCCKFCTKEECNTSWTSSCNEVFLIYPEITAEKLLQMICILNETACEVLVAENIENLKNEILETCIKVYNTPILTSDGDEYENTVIYDKIQQLFKN